MKKLLSFLALMLLAAPAGAVEDAPANSFDMRHPALPGWTLRAYGPEAIPANWYWLNASGVCDTSCDAPARAIRMETIIGNKNDCRQAVLVWQIEAPFLIRSIVPAKILPSGCTKDREEAKELYVTFTGTPAPHFIQIIEVGKVPSPALIEAKGRAYWPAE